MEVSQKPRKLRRSQVQGLRWGNWGDGLAGIDPETAMDGRGSQVHPQEARGRKLTSPRIRPWGSHPTTGNLVGFMGFLGNFKGNLRQLIREDHRDLGPLGLGPALTRNHLEK